MFVCMYANIYIYIYTKYKPIDAYAYVYRCMYVYI